MSEKELSVQEFRAALAKSIQDRIDAYKQELVELRQRELKKSADLDKGVHNVKNEDCGPGVQEPMMNKGDDCARCGFDKKCTCDKKDKGYKKSDDMIDLKNDFEPGKRLKESPNEHKGVLPGDKKSKVVDTSEGSGGDITKNFEINDLEGGGKRTAPVKPAQVAVAKPGGLNALRTKAQARKEMAMGAAPIKPNQLTPVSPSKITRVPAGVSGTPGGVAMTAVPTGGSSHIHNDPQNSKVLPTAKAEGHMGLFNKKPGAIGKDPIAKAGVPMAKPAGAAGSAMGAKPPTAPAVSSAPPASKPAAAAPAPKLAGAPPKPAMKNEEGMEKGLMNMFSKPKSSKVEAIKQAALARRAAKQPAMPKVEVMRTSGPPSGLPDKQ